MVIETSTDARTLRATIEDVAGPIPAEIYLRRDRSLRFQRDATIYATDGRVGVLRQVVVDQDAGEVTELIVTVEATGQTVVLRADLVDKTGGDAVFLTVNRTQFAEQAGSAPAYQRRRFRKARFRALRKNGKRAEERNRLQAVAHVGRDFVETPAVSRLDRPGADADAPRVGKPGSA
jgi:sporulation protein YlmC with PRC-barrel domain